MEENVNPELTPVWRWRWTSLFLKKYFGRLSESGKYWNLKDILTRYTLQRNYYD